MANHVNTRIYIVEGNEDAHKVMASINQSHLDIKEDWDNQVPAFAMWEDTKALADAKEWGELIDQIGSKWCFVEDWDDEDSITFTSAWSMPDSLIERIAEQIMEADPDAIVGYMADDEMPNWVACGVYADGEMWDEETIESEEYSDHDIKLWWDEDEEGIEEPDDFEPDWEKLWELLDDTIGSMIEAVKWDRDQEDTD
jgi:hypothetical protein